MRLLPSIPGLERCVNPPASYFLRQTDDRFRRIVLPSVADSHDPDQWPSDRYHREETDVVFRGWVFGDLLGGLRFGEKYRVVSLSRLWVRSRLWDDADVRTG